VDVDGLTHAAERALAALGAQSPRVSARIVEEVPRLATGKLKRFVALAERGDD
jgi:hypothetical protein